MSASLKRNYRLDIKQIPYYGILVISYLMLGYALWIFGFYKTMGYSDQILYI